MATFGYIRRSSAWEAGRGRREVQQGPIAGYARARGLQVDQTFVETGVSGWVPLGDRPQGKPLLDRLKDGDVVIITKLDRMFCGALDALDLLAELKERGISLHVIDLGGDVTGDRISKLVSTILSWVVAVEGVRIAAVRRGLRACGRYLGGIPPVGWRVGDAGDLVAVPEQQEALTRMRRLRADDTTLRAIAAQMRANGFQISHTGVKKVLDAAPRAEGCAGRSDGEATAKVAPTARRFRPQRQGASDPSLRAKVADALRENLNASQVAREFGLTQPIVSEIARAEKIALPLRGPSPMSRSEREEIVAALREMGNATRVAYATGWSPSTLQAIARAEKIALPLRGRSPMSPAERVKIVAALREMRDVTRVARATGRPPTTVRAIAQAENISLAHGNAVSRRAHGSAKRRERAD
jgi:putative DNA-invertase from lambdoid prophage Rac